MLQMVKQLLVHSNHNQDISESLVGYDNSPSLEEKEFKEQADKFVRNREAPSWIRAISTCSLNWVLMELACLKVKFVSADEFDLLSGPSLRIYFGFRTLFLGLFNFTLFI